MRTTSLDAFKAITADGTLKALIRRAYSTLYACGPMTGRELDDHNACPDLHKELATMRRLGIVKECEPRACRISGHTALTWDVTGELPGPKQPPKLSELKRLRRECAEKTARIVALEMENANLRQRLAAWGRPTKTRQIERLFAVFPQ